MHTSNVTPLSTQDAPADTVMAYWVSIIPETILHGILNTLIYRLYMKCGTLQHKNQYHFWMARRDQYNTRHLTYA